jgi:hypothetical protein
MLQQIVWLWKSIVAFISAHITFPWFDVDEYRFVLYQFKRVFLLNAPQTTRIFMRHTHIFIVLNKDVWNIGKSLCSHVGQTRKKLFLRNSSRLCKTKMSRISHVWMNCKNSCSTTFLSVGHILVCDAALNKFFAIDRRTVYFRIHLYDFCVSMRLCFIRSKFISDATFFSGRIVLQLQRGTVIGRNTSTDERIRIRFINQSAFSLVV